MTRAVVAHVPHDPTAVHDPTALRPLGVERVAAAPTLTTDTVEQFRRAAVRLGWASRIGRGAWRMHRTSVMLGSKQGLSIPCARPSITYRIQITAKDYADALHII